jgi:hypothetical protein
MPRKRTECKSEFCDNEANGEIYDAHYGLCRLCYIAYATGKEEPPKD